jgi:hypothetical protein
MEQQKDNFWLYIAGIIVLAIALVLMLKGREMESVPYKAFDETKQEVEKEIGRHKMQNK